MEVDVTEESDLAVPMAAQRLTVAVAALALWLKLKTLCSLTTRKEVSGLIQMAALS
jgi:hypothetical protein